MPTKRVGSRLKPSPAVTPQPLSAFRRAAPAPASPCKRRGPRGGGAGAPPGTHRGLMSPRTAHRPRGHSVASKGGGGERQAPSEHCSPSCPLTSAPGWVGLPRPLPSRRVCGERFRAAPRLPAPGYLRQGQALLGVQAAAPSVRGPRRGPGGRRWGRAVQ